MTHSLVSYIPFFLAIYLLANILVVGMWDVYALLVIGSKEYTVSFYLSLWAVKFPIGAVAVGIIIGHLCWPNARD